MLNRVDTIIFVLSIHDDDLLCEINTTECQYVCRNIKGMRNHCKRKHDWSKQKRRGNVNRESIERQTFEPWIAIRCQRFFLSRHGSQYFVVSQSISEEVVPRQAQSIVPVWQQVDQMMTQAWKTTKEKEARVIAKGEINEVNS